MLNSESSFRKYILYFDPKENSKSDVKNIWVVMSHIVKWFPVKQSKRGPTQCLNCGMFGHGISSCHRKPKCMLCGGEHDTKACPFNVENSEQCVFKCNNCKTHNMPYNHRANDPQCPSRLKYIQIKSNVNKKSGQKTHTQVDFSNSSFPPLPAHAPPPLNHTFADATKNNQRQSSTRHARTAQNEGELFTFAEVSKIMLNCLNDLAECKNKIDQMKVIANVLSNVFK